MDSEEVRKALMDIYIEYAVSRIDPCSLRGNVATSKLMASTGTWLVILAGLIGFASLIVTCTTCCMFKR